MKSPDNQKYFICYMEILPQLITFETEKFRKQKQKNLNITFKLSRQTQTPLDFY